MLANNRSGALGSDSQASSSQSCRRIAGYTHAKRLWIYSDGGPLHPDLVDYITNKLFGKVFLIHWL